VETAAEQANIAAPEKKEDVAPLPEVLADPLVDSLADSNADSLATPLSDALGETLATSIADSLPDSNAGSLATPATDSLAETLATPLADSLADSLATSFANSLTESLADPPTETLSTPVAEPLAGPPTRPLVIRGLTEILEQHGDWLDSNGESGIQADFSRENLEDADLIDARLQDALLNKTILKRADLMLADFRGASLLQANLKDTNLLGTGFHQANLQAATLEGATGLLNRQLAGANLFGAILPADTSPSEGLKYVGQVATRAGLFLVAILLVNALAWLRIFTTKDSQLLRNAPALPFFGLQADVPFVPFYLFGPVVILCLYICFHLYLQRLWDGAAQLPAIFPDGRSLDTCLPWFARWSARMHSKWLKTTRSPLAFLEAGIAMVLLYWITPATILLFWGRYLTLEDMRGTSALVLLVVGAITAAMGFPRMVGKAFGADSPLPANSPRSLRWRTMLLRSAAPIGIGFILLLLSIGIIQGVPHDFGRTSESANPGISTLAAEILWTAGYNPYAQLTEAEVSTKPPDWSGKDEEVDEVKGATLNRLKLRYIQAYGAFFAKARLWQADLRNAYLSEADLREANLRQADLQFVVLDRAKLNRASLQEADLRNANLNRANLREANLSSAVLSGATLLDATLDSASLYKADLRNALLQRANLKQADLREANLENANLTMANLQETYLTSTKMGNAQLKQADLSLAILTEADLRKSDLSGADLQGAILRGADISGANLQGANLRGAVGLTARQICSAPNRAQAQLDENLQHEVDSLCGSTR
jgi:uncharacterized protein YjbI with pentapeptide repeats